MLDRVPDTIQSRCQVFRFKKPSHDTLKKLVLDVAKKEGAALEPAAAELVALMGDGSFRDTLGILQKVLTMSADAKLTEAEVAKVVGAPPAALVNRFLRALAGKDIASALEIFQTAAAGGASPRRSICLRLRLSGSFRNSGSTLSIAPTCPQASLRPRSSVARVPRPQSLCVGS